MIIDKAEVIVLSEQEKQIGRSVLADGRLSFPTPLPLSGEPVAMDVADLDGDESPEVLYVARTRGEKSETYALRGVKRDKAGTYLPFRWGQEDNVPLPGLTGAQLAAERNLIWGQGAPARGRRRPDRSAIVPRVACRVGDIHIEG